MERKHATRVAGAVRCLSELLPDPVDKASLNKHRSAVRALNALVLYAKKGLSAPGVRYEETRPLRRARAAWQQCQIPNDVVQALDFTHEKARESLYWADDSATSRGGAFKGGRLKRQSRRSQIALV
jgi:hypothetical protein